MDLRTRHQAIREAIALACQASGRNPEEVRIIAVSKRHPLPRLLEALEAGLEDLGENRVQEGLEKIPGLPTGTKIHLLGSLQANKVNKVVGVFASIFSVDRDDLLARIDRRAEQLELSQPIWIQVNISGEEQKGGCAPIAVEELWARASEASALKPMGLMGMAEFSSDENLVRGQFAELRRMAEALPGPVDLSMGMSGDYEWAVQEGATHLRLGTVLFGGRPS